MLSIKLADLLDCLQLRTGSRDAMDCIHLGITSTTGENEHVRCKVVYF
jgi:hypothetical protein